MFGRGFDSHQLHLMGEIVKLAVSPFFLPF